MPAKADAEGSFTTVLEHGRSNVREALRAKLSEGVSAPQHRLAEAVEAAANAWAARQPGGVAKEYPPKTRSLIFNLKKNDSLRSRVS